MSISPGSPNATRKSAPSIWCWPTRPEPPPPGSTPRWRGASRLGRWRACRWRSRTTFAPGEFPRPARRGCSRVGAPHTTPPWCNGFAPPGRSSWARPTSTSSPWARPPRTPPSVPPATPMTPAGCPAAPAAARPRRWRQGSRRWRWAPTRGAPSGSQPRFAAWSASSPPTGRCRATGWSRSPRRSTRSDRSRPRWPTPPPATRRSQGTTRWTPRRSTAFASRSLPNWNEAWTACEWGCWPSCAPRAPACRPLRAWTRPRRWRVSRPMSRPGWTTLRPRWRLPVRPSLSCLCRRRCWACRPTT